MFVQLSNKDYRIYGEAFSNYIPGENPEELTSAIEKNFPEFEASNPNLSQTSLHFIHRDGTKFKGIEAKLEIKLDSSFFLPLSKERTLTRRFLRFFGAPKTSFPHYILEAYVFSRNKPLLDTINTQFLVRKEALSSKSLKFNTDEEEKHNEKKLGVHLVHYCLDNYLISLPSDFQIHNPISLYLDNSKGKPIAEYEISHAHLLRRHATLHTLREAI